MLKKIERPEIETAEQLDLMVKYFLDEAWKSKEEDLMTTLEYIQKYYLVATQNSTLKSQVFMDTQIEKAEKSIKSLVNLYTLGSDMVEFMSRLGVLFNQHAFKKARRI